MGIRQVVGNWNLAKLDQGGIKQCPCAMTSFNVDSRQIYYTIVDLLTPIILSLGGSKVLTDLDGRECQWALAEGYRVMTSIDISFNFDPLAPNTVHWGREETWHYAGYTLLPVQPRTLVERAKRYVHVEQCYVTRLERDDLSSIERNSDSESFISVAGMWKKKKSPAGSGSTRLTKSLVMSTVSATEAEMEQFCKKDWTSEDLADVIGRKLGNSVRMGVRNKKMVVAINTPDGACWWWALKSMGCDMTDIKKSHDIGLDKLRLLCHQHGIEFYDGETMPFEGIWAVDTGFQRAHAIVLKPINPPAAPRQSLAKQQISKDREDRTRWSDLVSDAIAKSRSSGKWGQGAWWEADYTRWWCLRNFNQVDEIPPWRLWSGDLNISKAWANWYDTMIRKNPQPKIPRDQKDYSKELLVPVWKRASTVRVGGLAIEQSQILGLEPLPRKRVTFNILGQRSIESYIKWVPEEAEENTLVLPAIYGSHPWTSPSAFEIDLTIWVRIFFLAALLFSSLRLAMKIRDKRLALVFGLMATYWVSWQGGELANELYAGPSPSSVRRAWVFSGIRCLSSAVVSDLSQLLKGLLAISSIVIVLVKTFIEHLIVQFLDVFWWNTGLHRLLSWIFSFVGARFFWLICRSIPGLRSFSDYIYSPTCEDTRSCLAVIVIKRKERGVWDILRLAIWVCESIVRSFAQHVCEVVWTYVSLAFRCAQLIAYVASYSPVLSFLWIAVCVIYDGWLWDLCRGWYLCKGSSANLVSFRIPYPGKDHNTILALHSAREDCNPDASRSEVIKAPIFVANYDHSGWNSNYDWSGIGISALQNLAQNGIAIGRDDRNRKTQSHHGHQYLRKCSDYMRCQNERTMMAFLQNRYAEGDRHFTLVNVGAKLKKDIKRWRKMWGLEVAAEDAPLIDMIHIRPGDDYAANDENWSNAGYQHQEEMQAEELLEEVYQPPAPAPQPAAANAPAQPVAQPAPRVWRKRVRQQTYKGTLEEWMRTYNQMDEHPVLIHMNDCHYYFPERFEFDTDHPLQAAKLYISGLNFAPTPGHYKLPDNCGTYTVANDETTGHLRIIMNPFLNGTGYEHPWIHVENPMLMINSGWIQHFFTTSTVAKWNPQRLRNIKTDVQQWYPQSDCMDYLFKDIAGVEWKAMFLSNSWASNRIKINLELLLEWTLDNICNSNIGKDTALLSLRSICANTENRTITSWIPRDRFRKKLVRIATTTNMFEYFMSPQMHETINSLGGIRVAGWTARNAPEWNTEWTSWKEFVTQLKKNCKTPSAKTKMVAESANKTVHEDYYEVKPISDADIAPNRAMKALTSLNPRIAQKAREMVEAIKQYCSKKIATSGPRKTRKTRHGPQFRGFQGVQSSYEWDSKAPTNLVHALFQRQLKSKLRPNTQVLRRFKAWFDKWITDKVAKLDTKPEIENWKDWIDSKHTWDAGKKQKYTETFFRQTSSAQFNERDWEYAFTGMVKSGEVYFRESTVRDTNGCLLERSDRPRLIFNPSKNACGPITWIQQFMFADLKKVIPGFIQGLTCAEMKDIILANKPRTAKCISTDGSAFDSHQHKELMEIVDAKLWSVFRPRIEQVCREHFPHPDVMIEGLLWQANQHDARLFIQLPDFESIIGSKFSANAAVRRFFPVYGKDWLEIEIQGTTFSGQPVKTTLGNTLRSLAYHEFTCYEAGISEEEKFVIAAGDDVCCWISDSRVEDYLSKLRELTHNDTNDVQVGLGQCIKDIVVRDWWDMDFCSKKCFLDPKGNWIISRDVSKAWREKMEYVGSTEEFHRAPERHIIAMAESARAEVKCPLLEEFFVERLEHLKRALQRLARANPKAASVISERLRYIKSWRSGVKSLEWTRLLKVWKEEKKKPFWIDPIHSDASVHFAESAGWSVASFIQFFSGEDEIILE
jgi:hypothetical protein